MSEQKEVDMTNVRTLVELCNAGYRKYDQAMPIEIPNGEDGIIKLNYCALKLNYCKFAVKNPIVIDGKEYYFCRK